MRRRLGLVAAICASMTACSMASYDAAVEDAPAADAVTVITPPPHDPADLQVLFWDNSTREARFREMENWFAGLEVKGAPEPRALGQGAPLDPALKADIARFMEETNATGVMVLQDGQNRYEAYRLGFGPEQRWTSFSVAKSFTSILLGAAIADGFVASVDDQVTAYIPDLTASAYDGVTVAQLAQMTSGVSWNEDYADPQSDVAQMARYVLEYGPDATIAQMKGLEREAPAGSKWLYKTGETNLLGLVVENAVGLSLAEYAKDKIVDPAGFAGDLFWMSDPRGGSIGGCCLSLRLSDYARFGQFVLEGAAGGEIVPDGWVAKSITPAEPVADTTPVSYGYQWWIYPEIEAYGAQGIFGQAVTIVPEKNLVVAVVSNWDAASRNDIRARWRDLVDRIAKSD